MEPKVEAKSLQQAVHNSESAHSSVIVIAIIIIIIINSNLAWLKLLLHIMNTLQSINSVKPC